MKAHSKLSSNAMHGFIIHLCVDVSLYDGSFLYMPVYPFMDIKCNSGPFTHVC
jgi:hypothetical protein